MARLESGKTYILKTVEYPYRWNPETQEDSPPPEKTKFTIYKDENAYIKREMPVEIEIAEGTYMLVIEVKTTRSGKRLVMAIWNGFGGWTEINPANWTLLKTEVYSAEEREEMRATAEALKAADAASKAEKE